MTVTVFRGFLAEMPVAQAVDVERILSLDQNIFCEITHIDAKNSSPYSKHMQADLEFSILHICAMETVLYCISCMLKLDKVHGHVYNIARRYRYGYGHLWNTFIPSVQPLFFCGRLFFSDNVSARLKQEAHINYIQLFLS